jgi:hypothetical protein
MPRIKNIKELKEAIKNLPDNMEIVGYDGGDGYRPVSLYTTDVGEEQAEGREEKIRKGEIKLTISTD